ncbi:MAG: hypothetical protein SGI77_08435 [Pirellulaceae bacterium]|nr:hypothetical protein [Pirellulaceae bacterium]
MNRMLLLPVIVYLSSLIGLAAINAQEAITSTTFLHQAKTVLPIEDRYDYHKTFLSGSIHSLKRSPQAVVSDDEIEIKSGEWTILVHPKSGPLTTFALKDTREYFQNAMQVRLDFKNIDSLQGWPKHPGTIVAGTREQLAAHSKGNEAIGEPLQSSKDYEIRVSEQQICVCGFDDAGVMHGLFHLQSRMSLREGPFLPRNFHIVRKSLYQTRMVLSWLGWMQWPDKYLSHLAHDGYDAIFASVYANPNGVEGPPHYDLIRIQDAKKLHDLAARAAKYGIRVYAAILFANTGEDDNKALLREHVRDIVTKFPDIRGYVLLTEGFYYKKFFGAGGQGDQDLNEWTDKWTEAVGIVSEECHRIDPAIEVLPWEYNIDFRPERVELKRRVVSKLPADTIPLLTWENGKQFEFDGLKGYLRDYSISQVGPAEVAEAQIDEAKRRGMKAYCKADCYATWQFGTLPYLPCAQQWQRRYAALEKSGINGTLESWSNGYKPNFVAELRCWSSWTDSLPDDELLKLTAGRIFGSESATDVVQAWNHFSQAIQLVPDTGPSMGTNNAVAHPLFFLDPPPRIMTLHNSWWDEEKKTPWRHRMVDAWPYCHRMMIFMPDFTNKKNNAESYARARSGIGNTGTTALPKSFSVLPVFNKYLLKAADELEVGLKLYRKAAASTPIEKQPAAFKEVLVAEHMQRMLRSLNAILEFEDHRLRLQATSSSDEASSILESMSIILRDEIVRTEESLLTARLDSRFGYECEMDYVYSPMVIDEKLRLLHRTLDEEIPAFRKPSR